MPDRRDAILVPGLSHRAGAALLGVPDQLHRGPAACRGGDFQGGVPRDWDDGRRNVRRGDRAPAGQRAGTAVAGDGAVAWPVRVRVAARPDAAILYVRARGLYRLPDRVSRRGFAPDHLYRCGAARAGNHAGHPERHLGAWSRAARLRHRRAAGPGRGDPARCGTLVARCHRHRSGAGAGRRTPPAGAGRHRTAPDVGASALRHQPAGATRSHRAGIAGSAVAAAAAGCGGGGSAGTAEGRQWRYGAGAGRGADRRCAVLAGDAGPG